MGWTKAPAAVGTLACAACLAIAGTMTASIPAAQEAARQAQMRLTAITDIAAFDAIPIYQGILQALAAGDVQTAIELLAELDSTSAIPLYVQMLLTGNIPEAMRGLDAFNAVPVYEDILSALGDGDIEGAIDLLGELDSTSAVPVYKNIAAALADGDIEGAIDELGGLDSTSAVPVYKDIAVALAAGDLEEAAIQTGNLDSVSAIDTFFGDGSNEYNDPLNPDVVTGTTGGVFNGGGVNALAPSSDGSGGYAALSALPVFAGDDDQAPFGLGVFTGGGVGALKNYDALSAIPAYLNATQGTSTTPPSPFRAPAPAEEEVQPQLQRTNQPEDQTQQLAAVAPPAGPAPAAAPELPKPSNNKQGEVRESLKFTPDFGGIPLFGSGKGNGVDNGIRGYGDMLKKVGLNGGEAASPSAGDPAGDTGGGEG